MPELLMALKLFHLSGFLCPQVREEVKVRPVCREIITPHRHPAYDHRQSQHACRQYCRAGKPAPGHLDEKDCRDDRGCGQKERELEKSDQTAELPSVTCVLSPPK